MATQTQTSTRTETGPRPARRRSSSCGSCSPTRRRWGERRWRTRSARSKSQVAETPPPAVESAGRIGVRLGKVSELTMIVPFAPGGAKRLRAFLRLLGGNFSEGDRGRHPPQHALRVFRQRHEDALRDRLRRRVGPLYRRLRDEDSRRPGHHRLCVGRLARDSQPEGERLDRQAPDPGRRLVCRPSRSDGCGDSTG